MLWWWDGRGKHVNGFVSCVAVVLRGCFAPVEECVEVFSLPL